MNRINVYETDEFEGTRSLAGWFDRDTAEAFDEATEWDGSNHISVPTGSQWNHEQLWRTAGGRWVLHHWSQWQGSRPSWHFVSAERAREWLIDNSTTDRDEAAIARHFGAVEPERGPGRPEVGQPVNIRLGDELLAAVDAYAEHERISRAQAVRRLVLTAIVDTQFGDVVGLPA